MKSKKNQASIVFLLSHQPNPRFVKQINFLSKNNNVTLIQFYRNIMNDLSSDIDNNVVQIITLETVPDSLSSFYDYILRINKYLLSILKLRKILFKKNIDIVISNNIDMLFLLKISMIFKKRDYKCAIEISDLLLDHESKSLKSKFFLLFERYMFKKVDKLIVTSPKFFTEHYNKVFFNDYFILENKPLKSMLPVRVPKKDNNKKIIGIVGLLLQIDVYEYLFNAIKNIKNYEVHIYGMGKYTDRIIDYSNKIKNIKYFGPYRFFEDASEIYSKIDILYMPYSDINKPLNNSLALPNKLYEAMYYKVPIITSKNTYLGKRVKELGLGRVINYKSKEELLFSIDSIYDNYDFHINNFKKLDESLYIADTDYFALEEYLMKDI